MGLSLRNLKKKVADVFSADSQEDQRKRLAAGQQRFYADQQRAMGNRTPGSNPLAQGRNLAISTVRGIARVPETAIRSGTDLLYNKGVSKALDLPQMNLNSPSYKDPARRFLYGSEPLETYQKRAEGYKANLEKSRFRNNAPVIAGIGGALMAVSDLAPVPKVPKVKGTALLKNASQAAEAQRTKYGKPSPVRSAETNVNPTAPLSRIDNAAGNQRGKGDTSKSLEHLANVYGSSARQADLNMQDAGIFDIVKKYGGDTDQGKEFNQYLNFRFAGEVMDKGKKKIIYDEQGKPYTKKEIAQTVKNYEAKNPEAVSQAQTIKVWADTELDKAVKGGLIDKDTADYVKAYYKNYVPLERILPDELARPTINAAPIGSIGRQSVLQDLQGSKLPLEDSFQRFINKGRSTQRQVNKNTLAKQYLEDVQTGAAPGTVRVSPQQSKLLAEAKTTLADLRTAKDAYVKKAAASRRGVARSTPKKNMAVNNAVARARKELYASVDSDDARAAISQLSKKDLIDIFTTMAEDAAPNTRRIFTQFNKRSKQHQALVSELDNLRGIRDQLKTEVRSANDTVAELRPDSMTGAQIISGFSEGYPFKIEVPPEIAKVLMGMSDENLKGFLGWLAKAWYPFRLAFTGLLNPVFSAMSFVFYDAPMSVINSPQGLKTFGRSAVEEMFKSFDSNSEFQKKLVQGGAQAITSTFVPIKNEKSVAYIASRSNLENKIKYSVNPKNIKQVIEDIDVIGAKLQNATRTRVAKAAYDKVLKETGDETKAIAAAVYDFNNVMPNYQNASSLMRQIDAVVPYFAASVAGTRALGQAVRRRPGQSLLAGASLLVAPSVATTAYSMSQEKGKEFYDDMIASKKQYILDNNLIIVLPDAKKDNESGEWKGVIKIPVAPEFRGVNQAVWRQTKQAIEGKGVTDPRTYAGAVFDSATGQLSPVNPVTGKFRPSVNPAINTGVALGTNKDLQTGRDVIPQNLLDESTDKQYTKSTGGLARQIGDAIGVAPARVQYVINSTGLAGKALQTKVEQGLAKAGKLPKDQVSKNDVLDQVKRKFYGAYGQSDGNKFYQEFDKVAKEIKNQDDRKVFQGLYAKKDKDANNPDKVAEKYATYLARPDVLEGVRKMDAYDRKLGKPGNPLFDLSSEQLNAVLRYRSNKAMNSAKQNYDKNGTPLFVALGLDEKWYDDFRSSEDSFYKKVKKDDADTSPLTYSGMQRPNDNDQLKALKDQYYQLPKGTGQRSSFLKQHPEILASWAADNNFTNEERKAIGLEPTDNSSNFASSSGSSGYSGGSSGSKSAGSAYKYAVGIKSGGGKVAFVRSKTSKGKPRVYKASKPKVSIKKSRV